MSPTVATGKAYLFKDVDSREALMTPKAEHTMAMARGLYGLPRAHRCASSTGQARGACPAPPPG
jgi:hypothetical protein